MSARFEVDIESCRVSFFSGFFESKDFGMLQALVGVGAGADDDAVRVHNNGPHARIGRRQTNALPSQIQCSAEEPFVNGAIMHFRFCTAESQSHREKRRD